MGSSYAAGPGIGEPADPGNDRCRRSSENYAHLLAGKRALVLRDVSCGGATTAHILGPWSELPAQIDAVTSDTQLVTVTIGGNDLNYMGSLFGGACHVLPPAEGDARPCSPPPSPSEEAYRQVTEGLRKIAEEVRRRAPGARLIFVDYLTVLPDQGSCAITPMRAQDADNSRTIARRLAAITAKVAEETGAEVLTASKLSHGHDACSSDPWMNGFIPPAGPNQPNNRPAIVPYHPNLKGMTAIAEALDQRLSQ